MVWTCLFLKFSFLGTTQRHVPCFRQEYISIEATASHLAIQESKHVPVQQVFFSSISSSAYRLRFAFSLSSCSASCCIIRLSPALVLADAADSMIADCSASAPGRISSVQSVITRRIHQHRTEIQMQNGGRLSAAAGNPFVGEEIQPAGIWGWNSEM